MALAIPGGAPGYDDDKQFGNFIAHIAARTSQRLREHSGEPPKVKGSRRSVRFVQFSRVPGVGREHFIVIPGWSKGPDPGIQVPGSRYAPGITVMGHDANPHGEQAPLRRLEP